MVNVLLEDVPTSLNVDESFVVLWTLYESDRETLITVAPDSVKLFVANPAGTVTEYTLGIDDEIQTITSPYLYRTSVILNSQGQWDWKFLASWTANPQTAGNLVIEGQIKVRSNRA